MAIILIILAGKSILIHMETYILNFAIPKKS